MKLDNKFYDKLQDEHADIAEAASMINKVKASEQYMDMTVDEKSVLNILLMALQKYAIALESCLLRTSLIIKSDCNKEEDEKQ